MCFSEQFHKESWPISGFPPVNRTCINNRIVSQHWSIFLYLCQNILISEPTHKLGVSVVEAYMQLYVFCLFILSRFSFFVGCLGTAIKSEEKVNFNCRFGIRHMQHTTFSLIFVTLKWQFCTYSESRWKSWSHWSKNGGKFSPEEIGFLCHSSLAFVVLLKAEGWS